MKKKIKVEQLKPGMYIHDFNSSWLDHPFFSNSARVRDEKIIEKVVQSGIREVYIDTERGLDVENAPTEEEANQKVQTEIQSTLHPELKDIERVPLQEELAKAKEIKKEAKQTIQCIMDEVRFGKQIEKEKAERVVMKMITSIFRNQNALLSLGRIKQADEYTYMHSMSVCVLMISFGKHLGFDLKQLRDIGVGALLHDIGKMKVPQDILHTKRPLTEEEFEKMKEHVELGRAILEGTAGIAETSVLLAAQHHERFDGSGYPEGLKGDRISTCAQAAAIVDVYDAITSERCYRRGLPPTEALRKIFEWSNCYFNNELVQQFIRCVGIYPVGSLVRLESGLLAVILNNDERSLLHPVVRVIYDTKKGKHVTPYDIDLSNGGGDRITSYEVPDKIHVVPEMYL